MEQRICTHIGMKITPFILTFDNRGSNCLIKFFGSELFWKQFTSFERNFFSDFSFFLLNSRHFIPLHETGYRNPLYTFLIIRQIRCHANNWKVFIDDIYFRFLALYRFRFTTVLRRTKFLKKKTIKRLNSSIYDKNQSPPVTYILVDGAEIFAFAIHVWL